MFPIRCDHKLGWRWPFVWQCRADAIRYLLHYPKNGYGEDPPVQLLCQKHYREGIDKDVSLVGAARGAGRPLNLSHLIKDLGNI